MADLVWREKPMPIELGLILEFSYTAGAEASLEQARAQDWTIVSIKNDWTTVFGE